MFKWFWTLLSLGAPVEHVVHSESLGRHEWLFRWFFVLDLNVTSLEIVKSGYEYFFFFNEINQHEKRVLVIDSRNCETCNVWRKLNRNQWRIQRNGPGAPPLIFRPNWGPKGQKHFFWRPVPFLHPLPLSQGLDPAMWTSSKSRPVCSNVEGLCKAWWIRLEAKFLSMVWLHRVSLASSQMQ